MTSLQDILAETEIDLPKIIFGLIFFAIWALSALVSWMNKKQQEAKRQRVREELSRATRQGGPQPVRAQPVRAPARRQPQRIAEGIAHRFPDVLLPPAPPPIPQLRHQQQQQPRPVPPVPKPARRAPKPQHRRAVPVPPLVPLEQVAPETPSYVNITQPAPRRQSPTVDADALRKWLSPSTLRKQFILTEILQPPLALRPDPHPRA